MVLHQLHKRTNLEGSVLAYDSITNGVEWIPMCSTGSYLLWAEEMSALALCNMVPHILDEGAERLDRFGECRDEIERDGAEETSPPEAPHEKEVEEETMDEGSKEKDYKGHEEEDEDAGGESGSHSSSESMQESPHSSCHYSDGCRHHCSTSWAQQCDSGNEEDGSFGELSVSENGEGEGGGEEELPQAPPFSPLCEQESLGKPPEVVGWAAPNEAASTVGDLTPTNSQDAIIVHAMEDEFRSIE